jgi:hypothetical protein
LEKTRFMTRTRAVHGLVGAKTRGGQNIGNFTELRRVRFWNPVFESSSHSYASSYARNIASDRGVSSARAIALMHLVSLLHSRDR